MASNYNRRTMPAEVLVDGRRRGRVIRRRQTIDDIAGARERRAARDDRICSSPSKASTRAASRRRRSGCATASTRAAASAGCCRSPTTRRRSATEIAQALHGERDYAPTSCSCCTSRTATSSEPRSTLLDEGVVLVCDRYIASSIAYGEAQGLDPAWLREIQRFLPPPDLTILLDIAPETAVQRKASGPRSLRARSRAAVARARQLPAPGGSRHGWLRLDGERPREAVSRRRRHGRFDTTRAAVSARTSRRARHRAARARTPRASPRSCSHRRPARRPRRARWRRAAARTRRARSRRRSAAGRSVCDGVRRVRFSARSRHRKPSRDVLGLVEAARPMPCAVQRHRHATSAPVEDVAPLSGRAAWPAAVPSERRAVVFERMDDRPERPLVCADRARAPDVPAGPRQRPHSARRGATALQDGSGSPHVSQTGGRMRATACQQAAQTGPAVGSVEALGAGCAGGCKKDGNGRIGHDARGRREPLPERVMRRPAPRRNFDSLSIAPEPLERVESARLRREDVDDEREVVHQDPLGALVALDMRRGALSPSAGPLRRRRRSP